MSNLNMRWAGALAGVTAASLGVSIAHAVTVADLGTFDSAATVTGSVPYTSGEIVRFDFIIDAPRTFVFTDVGSGGDFPFPIGSTATGAAGEYTETFGSFPGP